MAESDPASQFGRQRVKSRRVPAKSSAKTTAQGPEPGGPVPAADPLVWLGVLVGLGVPTLPAVDVTLGVAVGTTPVAAAVVGVARVPAGDGAGAGAVELGEALGDLP